MVTNLTNATSLTGNGLRDWLIQRVTSVLLGAYIIFLFVFFLFHSPLQFFEWQNLFACAWMRVFSILFLLSLLFHAWVGMWTVVTDYLKWTWFRLIFQIVVILALLSYFIWGVMILWSV